ncbi:hypothetical protein D3C81_1597110 [compost metagenome]
MAMVRNVDIVLGLLVIVDGVDHLTRRIGVIRPTTLLKLLRFHIQFRIFIQLKKLFLHFLHNLRACTALIVFTHFNRQHLFWLEIVKQIRTWQQFQRANQSFAKRQVENVLHGGCF